MVEGGKLLCGQDETFGESVFLEARNPFEHAVVFRQGDRQSTGTAADGTVARQQIAEVLVSALYTDEAINKTLELVAEQGPARPDLAPLFAALEADVPGSVNGALDRDTQPLTEEPDRVLADLESVRGSE